MRWFRVTRLRVRTLDILTPKGVTLNDSEPVQMAKKLRMDWWLVAVSVALALFGVIMVYSASAMIALRESSNQYTYVTKQFIFMLVGIGIMLGISQVHYRWLQNEWLIFGFLTVTLILLAAVFAFTPTNGARRWIKLAGFTFQPSEMAKPALALFLAYFLTKNEKTVGQFKQTILPCLMILGVLSALILLEPDLGTVVVLSAIFIVVYFAAGARLLHIAAVIGALLLVFIAALIFQPYRLERMIAYLDPWQEASGTGYQVVQSLMAVGPAEFSAKALPGDSKNFFTCRSRIRILSLPWWLRNSGWSGLCWWFWRSEFCSGAVRARR